MKNNSITLMTLVLSVLAFSPTTTLASLISTFSSGDIHEPLVPGTTPFFEIDVPINGVVVDINVSLHITHPDVEDFDVFLFSPGGGGINLFNDLLAGLDGVNIGTSLIDTVLDDEASTPITSGDAPFIAEPSYQPIGSLADFDGSEMIGIWSLAIQNDYPLGTTGHLERWALEITYDPIDAPEPVTIALMGLGLAGLGLSGSKRVNR